MSKYSAIKVTVDGHTFDSKLEAKRYGTLKLLVRAKEIINLRVHPVFELQPPFERHGKKFKAITYEADFSYNDVKTGNLVIEDTKGFRTEAFGIKEKLFRYRYPELNLRVIE